MAKNWPSVEAFVRCGSQWRHAGGIGLPVGLDYAGCRAALDMMGVEASPRLFADLQIMETAALPELAKRWSRR